MARQIIYNFFYQENVNFIFILFMIGEFAKNEKVIFNKEDMEEILKMKILKKHSRLKSDDNNRINVNDKFDWLEEQEVIYKFLYSKTFFMPFYKITPKVLSQIKILKSLFGGKFIIVWKYMLIFFYCFC